MVPVLVRVDGKSVTSVQGSEGESPGHAQALRPVRPPAADARSVLLERTTGWLSVELLTVDATAVLSVRGEVDLGTAPTLREALLTVLAHGTGPVVVDLSEVPFMDSAGVHVLVEMLARLQAQNRRFAIACREHGQVHRLLGLVGVLDAVTVHRSRESAVSGGEDVIGLQAP